MTGVVSDDLRPSVRHDGHGVSDYPFSWWNGYEMYVGSIRKKRSPAHARDSAGETAPPRDNKHKGEVGGSQKDCGRQQLSVSLADGENTTKGRPKRNTRRDARTCPSPG